MRPDLHRSLEDYRDHIEDIKEQTAAPDEETAVIDRLQTAADVAIERRSRKIGTERRVQDEIFELQRQKQEIMDKLHQRLRDIDHPAEAEPPPLRPNALNVSYDAAAKLCRITAPDGKIETATAGEVISAADWGLKYRVTATDESLPRRFRKRYFLERAKRDIASLLDAQVITEELARPDVHEFKKDAYGALANQPESDRERQTGHLAEKLVTNFVQCALFDADSGFVVERADAYEDVQNKVDFVLRRRDAYARGVKATADRRDTIGIQLTTRSDDQGLEKKRRQIASAKQRGELQVDDLVLVSLPIENLKRVYWQWDRQRQETGQGAGGPTTFLATNEKEQLLRGVLQGLATPEELDQMMAKLQPSFERQAERVRTEEERLNMDWGQERHKSVGQAERARQQDERAAAARLTTANAQIDALRTELGWDDARADAERARLLQEMESKDKSA